MEHRDRVLDKALTIGYSGAIGSLGGLSHLLYQTLKGEEFHFTKWISKIFLAFLIAWIVGEFIPNGMQFRDGILGIAGASSMQIMGLIELYGAKFVLSKTPIQVEDISNLDQEKGEKTIG